MATKAKYKFIHFLQSIKDAYPYTVEQSLGVLKWMIDTGQKYAHAGRWGAHTIECLLSRNNSVVGMYEIEPITSLAAIFSCLKNGIISTHVSPQFQKWRDDHDINAYAENVICFNHATAYQDEMSEAKITAALVGLFEAKGHLKTQLNECHSRAKEVYGVTLRYHHRQQGWKFVLKYGYQGSEWYKTLAIQKKGEYLLPVISRASAKLHEYMTQEKLEAKVN